MSEPQFCEVRWSDAWADGVDDTTLEDVHMKHRPLVMITRGWVLKSDDVGVSMFYEMCPEPLSYRGRTFIPRGMILSVEPYPIKRTRVKRKSPEIEKTPMPRGTEG